jgi:hypothetical protein
VARSTVYRAIERAAAARALERPADSTGSDILAAKADITPRPR